MGTRAGFHAGTVHGERIVVDGKYSPTSIVFGAGQLMAPDIDLVGPSFTVSGHELGGQREVSGVAMWGWDTSTSPATSFIGGTYIVPSSVPDKVKTNVNIFWTSSGVTGGTDVGTIIWDVDYRVVDPIGTSGVTAGSARSSLVSGIFKNATSGALFVSAATMDCALAKATLEIPKIDTIAGSMTIFKVYRDTEETLDVYGHQANLLAVEIEFVEG